jgi:CheY-like chemotaxis protein
MGIVLVADNDAGVRSLLAELARRLGFQVEEAADGEAAQALLRERPVDLLVCDLDMPKVSGQQLLAWLGQRPAPPRTLVVSGYVDAAIQAELSQRPFVLKVLRKPFDVMEFVAEVRRLAAPAAPAVQATSAQPAQPAQPARPAAPAAPGQPVVRSVGPGSSASPTPRPRTAAQQQELLALGRLHAELERLRAEKQRREQDRERSRLATEPAGAPPAKDPSAGAEGSACEAAG